MKLKNFHKSIEETPPEVREYVKYSMDILDRVHELLNAKFDGKQKLLADKMGKTEAEVSKMLSGVQNFTLKTLMKLQVAFGEEIIVVRSDEDSAVFEHVRAHGGQEVGVVTLLLLARVMKCKNAGREARRHSCASGGRH